MFMEQVKDLDVVIISGSDIVSHPHQSITYRVKCPKCGNVEESSHSVTLARGVTEVATSRCSGCGHCQMVKIKFKP